MPFVHGMTIGEIALWSKKSEGVLKTLTAFRKRGKLTIVPMIGWKRSMTWAGNGLPWHPTSPNIPSLDSVAGYPMTGLGAQMGRFKHGIGTKHPFRFLTFEGKTPEEVKGALESFRLPGLSYRIKTLRNSAGKDAGGVYLIISDWKSWKPTYLPFYMMKLSALWETPDPFLSGKRVQIRALFNKHVGSSWWWEELLSKGGKDRPHSILNRVGKGFVSVPQTWSVPIFFTDFSGQSRLATRFANGGLTMLPRRCPHLPSRWPRRVCGWVDKGRGRRNGC